jgi:hypothetical protein
MVYTNEAEGYRVLALINVMPIKLEKGRGGITSLRSSTAFWATSLGYLFSAWFKYTIPLFYCSIKPHNFLEELIFITYSILV